MRLCAQRDRAAFRRLYDLHVARMHGIALRITRDAALAADAVHDAWLMIWQRAGSFDPARGSAEAWLLSLARYRALDLLRRRSREVTLETPPETASEAEVQDRMDSADLRRCLGTLEEERRQLLLLAFVNGHSHAELAARLGQPLGTVKSWLRRSLASLRRCLDE